MCLVQHCSHVTSFQNESACVYLRQSTVQDSAPTSSCSFHFIQRKVVPAAKNFKKQPVSVSVSM